MPKVISLNFLGIYMLLDSFWASSRILFILTVLIPNTGFEYVFGIAFISTEKFLIYIKLQVITTTTVWTSTRFKIKIK